VAARMGHALRAVLEGDVDACESDLEALAPFESVMPTQSGVTTSRVLGLLAHAAGQKRRAGTSSAPWCSVETADSVPSSPGRVTIMRPHSWILALATTG
jgi:hypothetical protein